MLDIREEKTGSDCLLSLSGDLTVGNIGQVREKLMELYSTENSVKVNIAGESSIDFTFFQLMCSAHRTFSSVGKNISFDKTEKCPLELKKLSLGFSRRMGCSQDICGNCLWAVKENV
ncbi:MAG: STAS domain-containing protein [Deferribacterales bacterium]